MVEPLENLYFKWLCAKVGYIRRPTTPSLTHWKLLRILHSTEFVWLLSGDDNRSADGIELRIYFLHETEIPDNPSWRALPCSILEMFVGFSKRAAFATDSPSEDWFWEFLNNLGLKRFDDGAEVDNNEIKDILDQLIWRTYNSKGEGGMFPIIHPNEDQREVEIWYQFCQYLLDQGRVA